MTINLVLLELTQKRFSSPPELTQKRFSYPPELIKKTTLIRLNSPKKILLSAWTHPKKILFSAGNEPSLSVDCRFRQPRRQPTKQPTKQHNSLWPRAGPILSPKTRRHNITTLGGYDRSGTISLQSKRLGEKQRIPRPAKGVTSSRIVRRPISEGETKVLQLLGLFHSRIVRTPISNSCGHSKSVYGLCAA